MEWNERIKKNNAIRDYGTTMRLNRKRMRENRNEEIKG
jgi:hypothetical protein